ncbi:metal ABC transporter substrate-binding protein [Rubritalea tangerina]|uniref:Metal ABC transporter substrate-binding protein n=1 Tax=Rubritalea tangerina TaxID=430798 RepID=A0ABW4ZB06_9BACT
MIVRRVVMGGIAALVLSQCSETKHEQEQRDPSVAVVNYPLAYFTEQIVGDQFEVHFPVIAGDPAFWQPDSEEIGRFQEADLIILNGAGYAKWVDKVSLPRKKLVVSSEYFSDRLIEEAGGEAHSHGDGEVHSHGEIASTTWLDPQLAKLQLVVVYEQLCAHWPEHKKEFEPRFKQIYEQLLGLDAAFEKEFRGLRETVIVGSHPVYQYLARRYGLKLKSVHWEPGVVPSAQQWQELKQVLETHPASVMMWEGKPLDEVVQQLRSMGIESYVFDPCGNRPEEKDWMEAMQENLRSVQSLGKP